MHKRAFDQGHLLASRPIALFCTALLLVYLSQGLACGWYPSPAYQVWPAISGILPTRFCHGSWDTTHRSSSEPCSSAKWLPS